MPEARPNLLFLMCDQLQAQVFNPGHPCQTPNLDILIGRGVRMTRAYTPNAICSPARASLMTGLLPHSHNMVTVHHCQPPDANRLRTAKPHWAQQLQAAGYLTGYFGKWHVEHEERPERFGWEEAAAHGSQAWQAAAAPKREPVFSLERIADAPEGYRQHVFYGAHDIPAEERAMGTATRLGREFLGRALKQPRPWCCMVSVNEPHDPFHTHDDALARYDIDSLPLPASWQDPMADKPGLYRKLARALAPRSPRELREAAACYYASITEIDRLYGQIIDQVAAAGQLDNTIVILTTDHGELLGAHGLYCKNVGAFEEVYNIPMILAGPGIARGQTSAARVGLHDLGPTLLELLGLPALDTAGESRSFASVLRQPGASDDAFQTGFAEYSGARYQTTQRVYWHGDWKLVHNGFDFDELYNLADDPHELTNLAADPASEPKLRELFAELWQVIARTGDTTLLNTHYPAQRFAPFGPLARAD